VEQLKEHGIPCGVYYPVPLHLQSAYQSYGYQENDFPVSEALSKRVISLPMHTELSEDQQTYIAETIKSYFQ
jgi:dTDP-4-amino-4,6-dideoxygalactose transaminase